LLVICFAVLQISHVNLGMKDYDAVMYLPMYNCMFIVCTSTLGGIFFGEFTDFDVVRGILFPLGVLVTLSGIVVMSHASKGTNKGGKVGIEGGCDQQEQGGSDIK